MFDSDRYEVQQKMLSIGNSYAISEGPEGDTEDILKAKQKAFKMKEDFRFKDPDTDEDLFRVTTDQIIDYKANYTVVDVRDGEEIVGALEQQSSGSLRQKWGVFDADGEQVGLVKEDSLFKAFARRQIGLIPIAFDVYSPDKNLSADGSADRETLASVEGAFSFRDHYTITVDDDDLDPRLAVIGAVVIDAIQGN